MEAPVGIAATFGERADRVSQLCVVVETSISSVQTGRLCGRRRAWAWHCGDMSRFRSRHLRPGEAAELLEVLDNNPEDDDMWDSDEEGGNETEVIEVHDPENEEENRPENVESDEEQVEAPVTRHFSVTASRQETASEKKLSGADLENLTQPPEVFSVFTRREGLVAEWNTDPGRTQRRRDPVNILRENEGLGSDAARSIQTELDAFLLFFSDDILEEMVACTNEKLEEERRKFVARTREHNWAKGEHLFLPIDRTELLAFLALNVLRGTVPLESATELFTGSFAPAPFRAAMSQKRYAKLLASVRFDHSSTRADRRLGDKFCLMREVFTKFDRNLRRHYKPSDCLTIDETLVSYRGRCPFKVYMPTKPGKYGILVRSVADARSRYVWKLWPYSGKPQSPEQSPPGVIMETVPKLVHYLVDDVKNSGRNITMDR